MTEPMLIVLGILAGAVALWSWGRPRADIVAVLIVLGLMVSGVLTPQESLAGFGDPVVILIAAVFVVGAALENTGIVHRLSLALWNLDGGSDTRLIVLIMLLVAGPTAMLMVVFGAAALIGLFLSNAATTMLIAPVAIEAAQTLHVSPEAFAMTVVISCSASFVTPVSSTWNLLVMEPGGYSFGDYVKVGLPLLFLTMLITVTLVRLIYHF